MSKNPKVSVVTAVYNGQDYIGETIDSILDQDFEDFEFIIIDDVSTDNTAGVVKKYADKDPRIRLIANKTNLGSYGSANVGLKDAVGKYIARIDADDLADPRRLSAQVKFLDNDPKRGLTASWATKIDDEGNEFDKMSYMPTKDYQMTPMLFFANPIVHSSIMFSADMAKKFGGYNDKQRNTQDYDFYFRTINAGYKLHGHGKYLVKYRDHSANQTNINHQKQIDQISAVLIHWYKKLLGVTIDRTDVELVVWPPKSPTRSQGARIARVMDAVVEGYKKKWPKEILEIEEVEHRRRRLTSNRPLSIPFRTRRKFKKIIREIIHR